MAEHFPPPGEHDDLIRAALRVIHADHYGRDDDPHADAEAEYASEQLALAASAYVRAVDTLPESELPIGWKTETPATVWSGYDDEEQGFGVFATREIAQRYIEHQFLAGYIAEFGLSGSSDMAVTWSERKAYTEAHNGRSGMFDLCTDNGSTGYVVHELTVYRTASDAIEDDGKRAA